MKKLENIIMQEAEYDDYCDRICGVNSNNETYGESINGVSYWYLAIDYLQYIGEINIQQATDDEKRDAWEVYDFEVTDEDGLEYYAHHWFFSDNVNCGVFGVTFLPTDKNDWADIKFGVYGCGVDRLCSFDEMIQTLQDRQYINE